MLLRVCLFAVRSPEGKLSLYCKGADTIIYDRLHQSCSKVMDVTTEHLNVRQISLRPFIIDNLYLLFFAELLFACVYISVQEFAGEGLRTLALAFKDLDEEYFAQWQQRHHTASTELEDREIKLDELYEEIEKDLLVGTDKQNRKNESF